MVSGSVRCIYRRLVLTMFAGGMDAYVREFGATKNHDDFYADDNIIQIFKTYVTNIVSRYVDSPAILAWEIANDPR